MYPPPPYTSDGFQDQPNHIIHQGPPPPPYYTPPGPTVTQPHNYPPVVNTNQYAAQPAYRDYMGLSFLNIFVCCLPLGIFAISFSCKSREALSRGYTWHAAHCSATALRLNIAGIVVGTCTHIAWIAYLIYYFITLKDSQHNNWYG